MRETLIAGNWKMNMDWNDAMSFFTDLIAKESVSDWDGVEVAVIPPFPYLRHFFEFRSNASSGLKVGAQNCAQFEQGAYTGEVSASMLKSVGADYVIIGHSERRSIFNETDEALNAKTRIALDQGLKVIFCCGESESEREEGIQNEVIARQLEDGLNGMSVKDLSNIVIAYEPVWAIGTGKTATPDQAQDMHKFIRNWISEKHSGDLADAIRILYGGSVKPENAREILAQPDIDGGLIGGASLKLGDFTELIQIAHSLGH